MFKNVPIVFCPEANLGYQHQELNTSLRSAQGVEPILTYWNDSKEDIGFLTTQSTKHTGTRLIKEHLEKEKIMFSQFFFTNSKLPTKVKMTPSMMIDEFCSHLLSFELRWDNPKPNSRNKQPIARLSGKGGKNYDDLVMTLIISILAHDVCKTNAMLKSQIKEKVNKIFI